MNIFMMLQAFDIIGIMIKQAGTELTQAQPELVKLVVWVWRSKLQLEVKHFRWAKMCKIFKYSIQKKKLFFSQNFFWVLLIYLYIGVILSKNTYWGLLIQTNNFNFQTKLPPTTRIQPPITTRSKLYDREAINTAILRK